MDIQVLVDLGVFIIDLWYSYYVDLERAPLVDLHALVFDVKALVMYLQTLVVDIWALSWTSGPFRGPPGFRGPFDFKSFQNICVSCC